MGAVSLISFITLLIVVCLYTYAIPLPVKIVLIAVACTVFAVGILAVIEGKTKERVLPMRKMWENICPEILGPYLRD